MLERLGINETEMLYEAETAMLAAKDSLDNGKYDVATLQMRDALKSLIEGRNRLQVIIAKNPNRQQLAQLRQFDRTQQQKLRRPKSDEEQAREVVERLKELASEEDFVYKALAGVTETVSSRRVSIVTTKAYAPGLETSYARAGITVRDVQPMTLEEIFVANVMSNRREER